MLRENGAATEAPRARVAEPLAGAFFWVSIFYLVYCGRPEDWIPGLFYVPLAKISGIFALLGLMGLRKAKRSFRDLPPEAFYLLAMIILLYCSAILSPVWRGGALLRTIDFSKVFVAFILIFFAVSNFDRFRRIIFIQAASVAVIAVVSAVKGRGHARLEGVLGGIYDNPNDLAFAIVISLPLCFAFLLLTKNALRKCGWILAMLAMVGTLFLTASRGGFITLVVAGTVSLWHFGVRGKRLYLIVIAGVLGAVLMLTFGGKLKDRFFAIDEGEVSGRLTQSAHGSYEERKELIVMSLDAIRHYPILGIGLRNFTNYSGHWVEVHVAYLQIAVEGGIPVVILYLLIFWRGFRNLRRLRKIKNLDPRIMIFRDALHSSLVGFVVGALFSPEAYQFFPYFAVACSAALVEITSKSQGPDSGKKPLPSPAWSADTWARGRISAPSLVR